MKIRLVDQLHARSIVFSTVIKLAFPFIILILCLHFYSDQTITDFLPTCDARTQLSLYDSVLSHRYKWRRDELFFEGIDMRYRFPYTFDESVNQVRCQNLTNYRTETVKRYYRLTKYRGNILDLPNDPTARLFVDPESLYYAAYHRYEECCEKNFALRFDQQLKTQLNMLGRYAGYYKAVAEELFIDTMKKCPSLYNTDHLLESFPLSMELIKKPGSNDDFYTVDQFRARLSALLQLLEQREAMSPKFIRFVNLLRDDKYFYELYYMYYYIVTYYIKSQYVYMYTEGDLDAVAHFGGIVPCLYKHLFVISVDRLNNDCFSVLNMKNDEYYYHTVYEFIYQFGEILLRANIVDIDIKSLPVNQELKSFPEFHAVVHERFTRLDPEYFPLVEPTPEDLRRIPKISKFFKSHGVTPELYKQLREAARAAADAAKVASKNVPK